MSGTGDGYLPSPRRRARLSDVATTEFEAAIVALTYAVVGSIADSDELELMMQTVNWLRENQTEARILIGDLATGY